MHVTNEMRDKLVEYKRQSRASNVDIANKIQMTPQNLGRLIAGQTKSVNDESGRLILALLKMKESVVVTVPPKPMLRIHYKGTAMNPILEKDSIIMAESIEPGLLKNGDIVVARILDDQGKGRVFCRYFQLNSNIASWYPERKKCATYECPMTKIDWCARVQIPARELTLKD